jgi:hypothetical protein
VSSSKDKKKPKAEKDKPKEKENPKEKEKAKQKEPEKKPTKYYIGPPKPETPASRYALSHYPCVTSPS